MRTRIDTGMLAKRVGCAEADPTFRRAWAALESEGWTTARITTTGELREVVRALRVHLRAQAHSRGQSHAPPRWIRHAFAVSEETALTASHDPDVQAFRRDVLGDHLLDRHAVPQWIRDRRSALKGPKLAFQDGSALAYERVLGSPILDRLKGLVDALVNVYQWQEDAATTFVLTGLTPLRWPIRATLHSENAVTPSHVLIEVEPWVPPAVVRDAYARARRDPSVQLVRRVLRVTDKHRALVAFVSDRGGRASRQLARAWNKAYPRWRYDEANFIRTYKRVSERI